MNNSKLMTMGLGVAVRCGVTVALVLAGAGCSDAPGVDTPSAATAAEPASAVTYVRITTEKLGIRQFEPIYLKMENLGGAGCADCQFGRLEEGGLHLEIAADGHDPSVYSPPMKVCQRDEPSDRPRVEYETIILTRGDLVSRSPGRLELVVKNTRGQSVSNTLAVEVRDAENLISAETKAAIQAAPASYGMYVYLAGGDHLQDGSRIVHELAESNNEYSAWARPVLANNYAHQYYDWTSRTMRREADLTKVRSYFPRWDAGGSENIKLEIAQTLMLKHSVAELGNDLRDRLREIKSRAGDPLSRQLRTLGPL